MRQRIKLWRPEAAVAKCTLLRTLTAVRARQWRPFEVDLLCIVDVQLRRAAIDPFPFTKGCLTRQRPSIRLWYCSGRVALLAIHRRKTYLFLHANIRTSPPTQKDRRFRAARCDTGTEIGIVGAPDHYSPRAVKFEDGTAIGQRQSSGHRLLQSILGS